MTSKISGANTTKIGFKDCAASVIFLRSQVVRRDYAVYSTNTWLLTSWLQRELHNILSSSVRCNTTEQYQNGRWLCHSLNSFKSTQKIFYLGSHFLNFPPYCLFVSSSFTLFYNANMYRVVYFSFVSCLYVVKCNFEIALYKYILLLLCTKN